MSGKVYIGTKTRALEVSPKFEAFTKVTILVSDTVEYSAGTDEGRTLELECPWGTQAMAEYILNKVRGLQYQPYAATGALLDPAAELGDAVSVQNAYSGLYSVESTFGKLFVANVSAPAEEEINHEYPYVTSQEKRIKRQVNAIRSELSIQADKIAAKVESKGGNPQSFGWNLLVDSWNITASNKQVLVATKDGLFVEGHINATSGVIGGCSIADGKLQIPAANITGSLTIGQLPETVATTSDIPTKVSALTNDSGYETRTGVVSIIEGTVNADYVNALELKVKAANITGTLTVYDQENQVLLSAGDNAVSLAGWTASNNALYSGTSLAAAVCLISTGSTESYTVGSSGNIAGWMLKAGSKFGVTRDGTLYASEAKITGSITSDDVKITGGTVSIPLTDSTKTVFMDRRGLGCEDSKLSTELLFNASGLLFVSNSLQQTADLILVSDQMLENQVYKLLTGTWYVGSFGSAVQVTSDRESKYDIQDQSDSYSQLFDLLRPVTYKYKEGQSGRTHTGFVAQDVEDAVLTLGLNTQQFAAICYDLTADGVKTNYGIRYEEIVSMNTFEIQKLKRRVAELESRLIA